MHKILDDEYIGSSNDVKNFDFFIKREESFNRSLNNLKTKKEISDEFYKKLETPVVKLQKCTGWQKYTETKQILPIDPFLSMINSFKSSLAKSLDQILKPFVPQNILSRILSTSLTA